MIPVVKKILRRVRKDALKLGYILARFEHNATCKDGDTYSSADLREPSKYVVVNTWFDEDDCEGSELVTLREQPRRSGRVIEWRRWYTVSGPIGREIKGRLKT